MSLFSMTEESVKVDYNSDETVILDDGEVNSAFEELREEELQTNANVNDIQASNEVKTIDNKGKTLL